MSTFMAKKETLERKWYVIDAANRPLGRTAAAAANILRGKHRPEFTPHVDCVNTKESKKLCKKTQSSILHSSDMHAI